ncbi:MAG: hydroxymethylglutaryl-CoA lyase [Pseudomonadota bacterium]
MTERVRLVEVGPRDGLQNEAQTISVETKLSLIDRLGDAGLRTIEAGAFVSPKWVPQMAASDEVFGKLTRKDGVVYAALTPNLKGYERAKAAGASEAAVFAAASETFSQKNVNASIAETLDRFRPVLDAAKADGMRVRGYVSCVLGCPYEGAIAPQAVVRVVKAFLEMGCYEVSLGDTIGVGTPVQTKALLRALSGEAPIGALAGHYHDTYGQGVANIYASLEEGVRTFDASVSGLGGCPYAKGASGNVATEDVVYMLETSGFETGVDLAALVETSHWISGELGRAPASKAAMALRPSKD